MGLFTAGLDVIRKCIGIGVLQNGADGGDLKERDGGGRGRVREGERGLDHETMEVWFGVAFELFVCCYATTC